MMDGHLSGSVLSVADDVATAAVVAWSPDATATDRDRLLSKHTRWCGVSAAASSEAHAVAADSKTSAETILTLKNRESIHFAKFVHDTCADTFF